jgi:hypothetical protein
MRKMWNKVARSGTVHGETQFLQAVVLCGVFVRAIGIVKKVGLLFVILGRKIWEYRMQCWIGDRLSYMMVCWLTHFEGQTCLRHNAGVSYLPPFDMEIAGSTDHRRETMQKVDRLRVGFSSHAVL